MSDMSKDLQDRFQSAKSDLDAAEKSVRLMSAERLKVLLTQKSLAKWVAGLNDKALTPFDKAQLEIAIAGDRQSVWRHSISAWLGRTFTGLRRHRFWSPRPVAIAFIAVVASVAIARAQIRTAENAAPAQLSTAHDMDWTLPNETVRTTKESAGARLVLIERGGDLYLRRWFADAGYGQVLVTSSFVRTQLTKR